MVFLFFGLKLPLLALCWLVWWAIHQTDETTEEQGEDGGSKRPHPREPLPRTPRRGPHGDPALPSPPRVRTVKARARRLTQRTSSAGTGER